MIATLLALLALSSQPTPVPADFREAVLAGTPVVRDGFIGLEAPCAPPYDDETCFAGLSPDGLITGP
jgi:hypothetical protein